MYIYMPPEGSQHGCIGPHRHQDNARRLPTNKQSCPIELLPATRSRVSLSIYLSLSLSLSLYIYIYTYMCMYIYIYIYIYTAPVCPTISCPTTRTISRF